MKHRSTLSSVALAACTFFGSLSSAQAQTAIAVPVQPGAAGPVYVQPAAQPTMQPGVAIATPAPPAGVMAVPPPPPPPRFPRSDDPDGDGIPGVAVYSNGGVPQPVRVFAPPPAPQNENVPPPRRMGQVWVPGFYQWDGSQYLWVSGRWTRPPQPGYVWNPPQYVQRRRSFMFTPGYWGPPGAMPQGWDRPWQGMQPTVQAQPYQVGTMVTGTLDASDFRNDLGRVADEYAVFLNAGQPVTFVLAGGNRLDGQGPLDVYFTVLQNGMIVAQDDDSAGFPHARLTFTPRQSGVYVLRVTAVGDVRLGGVYTLQSQAGAVMLAPVQLPGGFGIPTVPPQPPPGYPPPGYPQPGYPQPGYPQPQPPTAPMIAAQPIMLMQQVQGTFAAGDFVMPSGGYADHYQITLQAGQPVTFFAHGALPGQFDPIDVMLDVLLDGQVIMHDDDTGGGHDAQVSFVPARTGLYQIRVTTFGGGARTGVYSLFGRPGMTAPGQSPLRQPGFGQTMPPLPPPQPTVIAVPGLNPNLPTINVGQTVSGTFNQGDATIDSGAYADTYQLYLQPNQTVTFYAQGLPFPGSRSTFPTDVTLDVLFNGQSVGHDDDSGGGRNAQLVFTAQQPGIYQVRVSTWGYGASEGAYNLQVRPGAQPTGRP